MADRPAYEIESIDADGNRQRAPVFQAVIEVLEHIPAAPARSAPRPDEIQQLAFNICLAAGFADMNDQPNAKQHPGGTDGDLMELQRAHDLLFDLADHLFQMHRGSRLFLEKHDPSGLHKLQNDVVRWSNRATEAWSELNKTEHRPSGGAPVKEVKAAIRSVALQAYERLLGRPAARKDAYSDPLTDYFLDLFGALGLPQDGAISQVRMAIKERNAEAAKNPPC